MKYKIKVKVLHKVTDSLSILGDDCNSFEAEANSEKEAIALVKEFYDCEASSDQEKEYPRSIEYDFIGD